MATSNADAATMTQPVNFRLPGADGADGEAADLRRALTERARLSEDDIRRVALVEEQLGLGFIEAAMRLGLISQSDLDALMSGDPQSRSTAVCVAKPDANLKSAHDPFDLYAENIRALRTELLARAPRDEANVFAIVSPGPREGRSRLASELAISFSQLGQSTLLIDGDLRKSSLHGLFGAANADGLAQALSQGRTPVLQQVVGMPSLTLLTSGMRADTPLELLSDPLMGELLIGWKRRHRHIILDTPPSSQFSDGLAIAGHAGRVLMLTRKNRTSASQTRDLVSRLSSTRASVIGCVLNQF